MNFLCHYHFRGGIFRKHSKKKIKNEFENITSYFKLQRRNKITNTSELKLKSRRLERPSRGRAQEQVMNMAAVPMAMAWRVRRAGRKSIGRDLEERWGKWGSEVEGG